MPDEIETAIGLAERDPAIKVIVLRGAGRAFSGGYDFGGGFKHWGEAMNTDGRWDPGKDFAMVSGPRRPPAPEVHGHLARIQTRHRPGARLVRRRRQRLRPCADIVIASDDAVIGTPYARMWGTYLPACGCTACSFAKVKWHSLTGEPLTGKEAAAVELINESVPFDNLEARVDEVAAKLARIPLSQLQAQKLIVNQAYENMGLASRRPSAAFSTD